MFLRSAINRPYHYTTIKRNLYTNNNNNIKSKPDKNEINEFIVNSIKVIVLSSVIWGFESNRKYQLHHLEVNHRILSNFSDCLKRHNTRERCEHEKQFLRYIFKQDY